MKATTVSTKATKALPAKKKVVKSSAKKAPVTNTRKVVKKTLVKKGSVKKTNYSLIINKATGQLGSLSVITYCLANPIP